MHNIPQVGQVGPGRGAAQGGGTAMAKGSGVRRGDTGTRYGRGTSGHGTGSGQRDTGTRSWHGVWPRKSDRGGQGRTAVGAGERKVTGIGDTRPERGGSAIGAHVATRPRTQRYATGHGGAARRAVTPRRSWGPGTGAGYSPPGPLRALLRRLPAAIAVPTSRSLRAAASPHRAVRLPPRR